MLSVACGMEHTLALCSDGVRFTDVLFIDPVYSKEGLSSESRQISKLKCFVTC